MSTVTFLISKGADVNAKDKVSFTTITTVIIIVIIIVITIITAIIHLCVAGNYSTTRGNREGAFGCHYLSYNKGGGCQC